jgi:adenine-specific DNA-methyltransferase
VCGDAIEVLTKFPSESVDLVHTSPPYNIDKPYEFSPTDRTSAQDYQGFLLTVINELKRVLKPGGAIFWQTGYTQNVEGGLGIIPIDLISYNLFCSEPNPMLLWDRIIWRYWGGHAFTKKFTNKHETILWFVKPGKPPTFCVDAVREKAKEYDKRNNFWGRNPGNVWEVDRVAFGSSEQTSHIAVFPEEITERIVRACSKPTDLVLDPFSGSGTVAKVAHGLDRRWIGIEISPLYTQEACMRVGYQQPSEPESLASELIKRLAFRDRPGTLQLPEVLKRVSLWAKNVSTDKLRNALDSDIEMVFSDGRGRNLIKRDIWMKYDGLMDISSDGNPVILANELLSRCYKLRQHFNGVTRFKTALTALTSCMVNFTDDSYAAPYAAKIASQEPSSFKLTEVSLTFTSPARRVSSGFTHTQVADVQDQLGIDQGNLQRRFPL